MREPIHIMTLGCLLVAAECQGANKDYERIKPEQKTLIESLEAGKLEVPAPMPWRLFVPPEAGPDKRLPLVVFLHGAGMRGTDNAGPMSLAWSFLSPEAQALNPCFVLAPQVRTGHRWVDHPFQAGHYDSSAIPATPEMLTMLSVVERLLAERPIDPKRVYVVGQSMGGFGAWDAITRRPDLWAAAVPICGAGDPAKAAIIRNIPVWAWHGENDTMVPVEGSRAMVAAIEKAGGKPKYTEIPAGGHGVWNRAFADPELYRWLFEQYKP